MSKVEHDAVRADHRDSCYLLQGFVGLCGALLFGCGIPGAILLGLIAMKTGRTVETVKVSYSLTAVFLIIFCQVGSWAILGQSLLVLTESIWVPP